MRTPTDVYHVRRFYERPGDAGYVFLDREEAPHVHTKACVSDLSTPGNCVLKCGQYDAAELARMLGTDRPERVSINLGPAASLALRNHSPTGFEFGYGGSGPSQLALAILLDCTGDADLALRRYQDFKWRYVARWKGETASITAGEIAEFLHDEEAFEEPRAILVTNEVPPSDRKAVR